MISKIVLLLFVSIVVVSALTDEEQFDQFKKNFNKHYTPEEEHQRFLNFQESLKRVAEQNAKHAAGQSTHTSAINQFSDLSHDEWAQRNHGLGTSQHDHHHGH